MSKRHEAEQRLLHYGVKGMKWSKGKSLANDGIDVEDTEVNGVAYDDEAIDKIEAELAKETDPAKIAELKQALAAYKLDREASVAMSAYAKAKKSGDPEAIKSAKAKIDAYSKNIAASYDKGTKKSSSGKKEEEKKGSGRGKGGGSGKKSSGGSKGGGGGRKSSGGSGRSSGGSGRSSSNNDAAKQAKAQERERKAAASQKAREKRAKEVAKKKKEAAQKKLLKEKAIAQRKKDKAQAEAKAKKEYDAAYKKAVKEYKEEQDAINATRRNEGKY